MSSIEILQNLVRIPSLSGQEKPVQDYIYNHFQVLGLREETQLIHQGENIVVHLKGKNPNKALMLIPHVDVVDPGNPADWFGGDPFSAEKRDGKIYGRGACDTKAGVYAAMETANELFLRQKKGEELPYDIWCVFTVGEEADGRGMIDFGKWFQKQQDNLPSHKQYNDIAAIFLEPTNLEVNIGHKGNLVFDIKTPSLHQMIQFLIQSYNQSKEWAVAQADHLFGSTLISVTNINSRHKIEEEASETQSKRVIRLVAHGDNLHVATTGKIDIQHLAVNKMVEFLSKIYQYYPIGETTPFKPIRITTQETKSNKTPTFIELDLELTPGSNDTVISMLRELAREYAIELTDNIDDIKIHQPIEVAAKIDIRTIPGHHDEAKNLMVAISQELGIACHEKPGIMPASTDPESSILKAYKKAIVNILKPIAPGIFIAASDMGVLKGLGGIFEKIQAVIFGAGDLNIAHTVNEFVPIKQVEQSLDILLKWYYAWE